MARSLRRLVVPLYVLACLLLGGSTRAPVPNMVLQLGAIAILAWAALAPPRVEVGRHGRPLAILVAAMGAVVLLQLVPLPPALWSALPGRGAIAAGFDMLGQPRPWLPLSLAPYDSMASALWLLPPLAVLAGILRLGAYREQALGLALLAAAFVGVMLGALQVMSADPQTSPWYLYPITNNGQPAGLFANANHMAALLVVSLPFVIALYGVKRDGKRAIHASAGKIAILGGAMLVLIVGLSLNNSLAALGLALPVLAASMLVREPIERARTRWGLGAVGLLGALAVVAMAVGPFDNNLTAAGADKEYSSRYTSFTNSIDAARDHLPIGSGLGSFARLYPAYENADIVDNWFVNHVHNDFIELALETGLPGMLLMAGFLLWWTARAVAVWRAPLVNPMARAATVASFALLAHSLVEFPLRGSGLAAVFAMCVALMAAPRRVAPGDRQATPGATPARHLSVS
jgi:O-antigen ligase